MRGPVGMELLSPGTLGVKVKSSLQGNTWKCVAVSFLGILESKLKIFWFWIE